MKLVTDYFRELGSASLQGWNRFWFSPADPATLGVIRILAGAMLFYTHLVWTKDLVEFFGPQGRLPIAFTNEFYQFSLGNRASYAWSHLYFVDSPSALWSCHLLALLMIFLFTIGCFTRITAILTFLITVSYAHRAVGALFGLDQINGMLALYLAIGPSGSAYSLDRWRRRKRQARRSSADPDKLVMANVAQRLIQVHMCIIYFFAGVGKLMGQTWWAGTALWGAFANYEYQTIDMTWLAAYPLVVNFVTQLILAWEITYPVLIWPRLTRPLMLFLAVPLHLGIALGMGMTTFGLAMLIGNVAFVSPTIVRLLFDRRFESGRAGGGSGNTTNPKRQPQTQSV